MSFRRTLLLLTTAALSIPSMVSASPFSASTTYLISKKPTMAPTPKAALAADSGGLRFTYDGKYATFWSKDGSLDDAPAATDHCSGTTFSEIYWLDGLDVPGLNANSSTATGRATCVSLTTGGGDPTENWVQGNGNADAPYLSQDGRYVAFQFKRTAPSGAEVYPIDLEECVTDNRSHLYVHDRKWELTTLSQQKSNNGGLSFAPGACPTPVPPATSAEDATGEPDGDSFLYGISANGQSLLLTSDATNIADNVSPPRDTNGYRDIYTRNGGDCVDPGYGECMTSWLHDDLDFHVGGSTIAELNDASDHPAWSSAGDIIVFDSLSSVPIFFAPDDNGARDVFLWMGGHFFRISQSRFGTFAANGDSAFPTVSGDGRWIAYQSTSTDLVASPAAPGSINQIYLHDRTGGSTKLISKANGVAANGDSRHPMISGDGRYIAYESLATNLVSGVTINPTGKYNVYLFDVFSSQTYLVTEGSGGTGANDDVTITDISTNGLYIGLQSKATNLQVAADANGAVQDVFIAANSCPTDADGDGTPDCIDLCPGAPDADSDEDGVVDCRDLCPNAPDTDLNGNGAADCQDPTAATVPTTPTVRVGTRGRATVTLQAFPGQVVYRLRVRGPKNVSVASSSKKIQLTKLKPGSYLADYTVEVPNGTRSKKSRARRFTIR